MVKTAIAKPSTFAAEPKTPPRILTVPAPRLSADERNGIPEGEVGGSGEVRLQGPALPTVATMGRFHFIRTIDRIDIDDEWAGIAKRARARWMRENPY